MPYQLRLKFRDRVHLPVRVKKWQDTFVAHEFVLVVKRLDAVLWKIVGCGGYDEKKDDGREGMYVRRQDLFQG